MGFFKELKEDLSQAVNELIPEDELLEDEYVDNLDDELLGLDEVEEKEKSDLSSDKGKKDNKSETDLELQLEEDTFVNTLDDERSSTLEKNDISESVSAGADTEDNLETLSFEFDENPMDDISDLVKEFENQMMAEDSKVFHEEEMSLAEESETPELLLDEEEDILEEPILEEALEEPPIPLEEEAEEDNLSLTLEEDAILEESLPIEDNENAEDNEYAAEDDLDLMDILENEIQDTEHPKEDIDKAEVLQEDLENNVSLDVIPDIIEEEVQLETESEHTVEGEGVIEQQMEEETMSELDGVLEQTDNLENENVDMDLIAQMLGEKEESPLVMPDEMPDMEEPIDEAIEEEVQLEEPVMEEAAEESETPVITEAGKDVTVITKGTRIEGNIISDSSLEVMGTVKGDIECLGKLSVTGHVEGNSSASEIFVNTTRLQGNLLSKGTVKLGAGTVVFGDIAATSAVIAGAVKGEIDVNGPIVVDSTAIVKGNIKAKSVQVNNGAVIDGYCSLAYAALDIDNFFDGENAE